MPKETIVFEKPSNQIRREKKLKERANLSTWFENRQSNTREVQKTIAGPKFTQWAYSFAEACCRCYPHNSDGTAHKGITSSLINQVATAEEILNEIPKQDAKSSPVTWLNRRPAVYQ